VILVAVDFSPPSASALLWAARIAEATGARLTVLHVVHDPEAAPGYYRAKKHGKYVRRLEDAASEMFDTFVEAVAAEHPDIEMIRNAERRLEVGLPVTRVLEVAKETEASLVVVGSHGRSGITHALLGSKAERIARRSPVPVTIVKAAIEEPENGYSTLPLVPGT
jgi:universal stress protein A